MQVHSIKRYFIISLQPLLNSECTECNRAVTINFNIQQEQLRLSTSIIKECAARQNLINDSKLEVETRRDVGITIISIYKQFDKDYELVELRRLRDRVDVYPATGFRGKSGADFIRDELSASH